MRAYDPIYRLLDEEAKTVVVATDLSRLLDTSRPFAGGNVFKRASQHTFIRMLTGDHEDNVYRVEIAIGFVRVLCLGMERVDACGQGVYHNLDEIPQWMQEQVAKLSMLSGVPPTENVVGVGRRISENTYWVYKPYS